MNVLPPCQRPRWLREAREAGRPMLPQHRSRRSHNAINAGVLVTIVVSLALTTWALTWLPMPAFVSLGGLAYGLTVYAGLAVVVHEASHRMFFLVGDAAQTRAVNRVVGWTFSLPFAVHYVRHQEEGHAVRRKQVVGVLVWVFYLPALALLAWTAP